MRLFDGVVPGQEHLDDLVVVVVGGEDERGDVRRELALLLRPEESLPASHAPESVLPGHEVGVLDDDLDDLGAALADGVQQRLLDAVEAEVVQQDLDDVQLLRVDGQVKGVAAHVVHAVDGQVGLGALLQWLADDAQVPQEGGVQEHPLLVRQLSTGKDQHSVCCQGQM